MSLPLRKEQPEFEENLTTADLAPRKRPASEDLNQYDLNQKDANQNDSSQRNLNPEDRPRPILAAPSSTEITQEGQPPVSGDGRSTNAVTPLFPNNELEELRNRWIDVQTTFVDEPRSAVEQADGLVAAAMKRLAEGFAAERSKLERQWDSGDDVSTEDLRIALQRYRSFFQRLLAV
jgi:hypothetical protein